MALTIKAVFQGSNLGHASGNTRYYVTGLDATTPEKMWDALFAGGLPQPEDPHQRNNNLIVDRPSVTEMVGEHSCFIDVPYKTRATTGGGGTVNGVEVEMDGSLVAVVGITDYNGHSVEVIYNPLDGTQKVGRVNANANDQKQGNNGIERMIGMKTLRYSRTEDIFPAADRWTLIGKTNSNSGWVLTGDKGLWLCSRISARLAAGATKPSVSYEFQGPEDGWEKIVAYIEPTTGQPPGTDQKMASISLNANEPRVRGTYAGGNGITAAQDRSRNGITLVKVQGEADFNTLGLPALYA